MGSDASAPLVVIGHSHTETVAAAARADGVALDLLNFWHLPNPFVEGKGPLRLVPALATRLVSPVFSMVGGAVHQDIGLVMHPRPFDFVWPGDLELPVEPHAEIIPYDAVHASVMARTEYFLNIMGAVRAAANGTVFHLESPPPHRDEQLPQDDPGFYHLFGADAQFSPAWLRYKLWRVHSGIVADYCAANAIAFIAHPPGSVTEDGFLRPELHGTPAHANAAYGALLLAQMRHEAAKFSSASSSAWPTAAQEDPQHAAVPPEVHGWVDGWHEGAIVGWACWPPDSPYRGDKVVVEAVLDGAIVGDAIAALPRPDVADAGRNPDCGFHIRLDQGVQASRRAGMLLFRARNGGTLLGVAVDVADAAQMEQGSDVLSCWPPTPWRLQRPGLAGYIDQFGPGTINGWAQHSAAPSMPVVFSIWEDGRQCGLVTGDQWRKDLEETRAGDGRWGFGWVLSDSIRDGRIHRVQLRLPDGAPLVDHEVLSRFVPLGPAAPETAGPRADFGQERRTQRSRPARNDAPFDVMFSIVVNFYNMEREAGRTLTSLTRAYQRDIGDLRYEVLCVDNGSNPPMGRAWVEAYGTEFRLIRPERILPSCCNAINEAVAEARGRYVAIMIDGAHVLTPGVLREVWDALSEAPDAVVGLRPWFVGGDQRWLAEAGYTRAQEDILFDKIAWPSDGYRLFSIGEAFWESPRPWFDAMIESNCLFVPRALYRQIGGMDERFSEPGAGYANLDLFRRATSATAEPLVALIGEATFHQFHDGTTTNAVLATKEARVRAYESHYIELKGETYPVVEAIDIRVRGQVRTRAAMSSRQRPGSPAGVGVTDLIRKGSLPLHFDISAQDYLQSVYVEAGLHQRAAWLGKPLGVAPSDALTIQDLVFRLRPGRIIGVNMQAGLVALLDSVLRDADLPASRIIAVSSAEPSAPQPRSVRAVVGDTASRDTLARVARELDSEEHVLVLFSPDPGDLLPIDALSAYAGFVTCRSYLVVLGTALGQPWLGYSKRFTLTAIRKLLDSMPFAIDQTCNPHLESTSPLGYLQRIEGPSPPDTGTD